MSRQTLFTDVCGTMDELKRLLHEEHEKVSADPMAVADPLLSDALFMLERMEKRIAEYKSFREALHAALSQLQQIENVNINGAEDAIARLRGCIKSREAFENTDIEAMSEYAERVRSVASAHEHCLRRYKDLALKINSLLIELQGARPWLTTEDGAPSWAEDIKRKHQAWLPPEPHNKRLFEWLAASRAHIADRTGPDGEPFVQFEDGGNILMSQIRWNPEIRNFHPAAFKPGSTGRKYRRQ